MSNDGSLPEESATRIQWRCEDPDCTNERCDARVLWSDNGHIEIRGEIRRNPLDGKLDWSVRVDHYGTSEMTMRQVEQMVTSYARRMAAQVGMVFRGQKPKEAKIRNLYALDD